MARSVRKKLFRISRPYGYYMEDVEKAVQKYEEVIDELLVALEKRDKALKSLEQENARIKKELYNMQLEMSMLELPDMTEIQQEIILNRFKQQKTETVPKPTQIRREDLDLPVIGDSTRITDEDGEEFEIIE